MLSSQHKGLEPLHLFMLFELLKLIGKLLQIRKLTIYRGKADICHQIDIPELFHYKLPKSVELTSLIKEFV